MAPTKKTEVTDGSNLDPEANKSTHQRYLESLVDGAPRPDLSGAKDYTGDGNDTSAYVGVNPEYQNYANETEKPYQAEEGSALREAEDAAVVAGEGLVYSQVSGSAYQELAAKKAEDEKAAADKAAEETRAKAAESTGAADGDTVKTNDGQGSQSTF